ncbi:hypothetical protein C8R47DRAFT_998405 [Mycena vitilis]|nr:hypothetical protein C8R47DRAFT_998405 [Mycena vitilis]
MAANSRDDTAATFPSAPQSKKSTQRGRRVWFDEELHGSERVWYKHREWLESKGYALRARYQEGWTASWKGNDKKPRDCDDGTMPPRAVVMDAIRVEDGAFVLLKKISKRDHPFEVEIGTWLNAESRRSDPENHCVPIYDVLESPLDSDIQFIVMPLLQTYDKPRFDSIGEAIAFFKQIFEGLRYMHKNLVAHRDCMSLNIMVDGSPLYSTPHHPWRIGMKRDFTGPVSHRSRTERPVRYYLTDFGISRRYKPENSPFLEGPILGGDKSVPEFRIVNNEDPPDCDPFPTDVYYIGNLIRGDFLRVAAKLGFGFMEPLVMEMVNPDPSKRPTMDEVVERFEDIVRGLSSWKLRSEVSKKTQHFRFLYTVAHWALTVRVTVARRPAIPMPNTP